MNKYRNVPTEIDGMIFASKKEARRYLDLCLLQIAKEITHLKCQVRFTFEPLKYESGRTPFYVADFTYYEKRDGLEVWWFVVEDVKSKITANNPAYKLKKALMVHFHDIKIRET